MTDPQYTSIKVTKKNSEYIEKAAKRYGASKGEFVYQCAFFVHKHRYDPYQLDDIKIAEEFMKLKNQLISFIRTQEKNHILPMHKSVNDMQRQVVEFGGIMEVLVTKTVDFEEPQIAPPTSSNSAVSDDDISKLRKALELKNQQLSKAMDSLGKIKNASKKSKNGVFVNIPNDNFLSLVSLDS